MCGRYAMALRPSQVRQMLQDNDDMPVNDAPADEGDGAPRQSYNFAPGYHGVVYRADVSDRGAGTSRAAHTDRNTDSSSSTTTAATADTTADTTTDTTAADQTYPPTDTPNASQTRYKLQSMKWGLVPSWTKRNPDYSSLLKTINCRSDSLATPGGLWSGMKGRKRCVVVAQGFYEWLKTGSGGGGATKDRVPHYVKRKDGRLMFFAGLWDCVRYEGEGEAPLYTFTVVTTDSNERLRFLHDRMPVILEPGSEALWKWLDPGRDEWSKELQGLLRPFEGELEVYPVSKEVGKVGNNSPSFVIPVASRENKANIANFFAAAAEKKKGGSLKAEAGAEEGTGVGEGGQDTALKSAEDPGKTTSSGGMGTPKKGIKREASPSPDPGEPPVKKGPSFKTMSPVKEKPQRRGKISATSNTYKSPTKAKAKADGSQKITKFFVGNSA
ncbi:uncharacterized protein B0H64DRAFT_325168 [Chaetomium fimeti]|uniref:DUF159-domain-containing protein n=1 Tax=Chaetomium fimeti TaxID=1854472 RepID=A0AAE0LRR5_9PEZI|nr:hypothetical protein B0H64DRAFT_325168 [Chaetomium fimeti]